MNDPPSETGRSGAGPSAIQDPPRTWLGVLRRMGPGMIIAGSIVGSGELIATTKTGAEAGFWLLWLIVIGCMIKVFIQVEFGRFSIINGVSTMSGLNQVAGPVLEIAAGRRPQARHFRGNWIVWYWFLVWLASVGQLGGIVGGVGQAMAISLPLTTAGREFNAYVDHAMKLKVARAELDPTRLRAGDSQPDLGRAQVLSATIAELEAQLAAYDQPRIRRYGEQHLAKLAAQYDPDRQNNRMDRALLDALGAERFAALCAGGQLVRHGRYQQAVLAGELGQAYWMGQLGGKPPAPWDDRIWAAIIAVVTSGLLIAGRYGLIQNVATVLVCGFTATTVINLLLLQMNPAWAVTAGDVVQGLSFRLPPDSPTALATAMATFGIIGVGATEIVFYPYWCLEKGYARFTGPRDDSPAWAQRARGWMRVLSWDAWCSMVLYTFATIAFYLLGAATLGRSGLNPASSDMIRTLQVMYEPVFGESAWIVFLVGAFAVLYSTFFVANASHARVFSDTIAVLGLVSKTETAQRRRVVWFSGLFPLLCLVMYVFFPQPTRLVLISGVMQAFMLPMLAVAGLYFRYRCSDPRLEPGKAWDVCLWLSAAGMSVAGIWALLSQF